MKLNIEQSELLYEIAEIHLNWVHKYNKDSETTFDEILEINHNKLLSYFSGTKPSKKTINEKLFEMRARVLRLKDEY